MNNVKVIPVKTKTKCFLSASLQHFDFIHAEIIWNCNNIYNRKMVLIHGRETDCG